MSNEDPSQVDEHYDLRVSGSFKIGRSNLCNIILKDGHVSKVHCSLNICGGKDDPSSSSSAGSKCQVLISDHSSNGTWISSSNGETIKLEKGKPTLLKEDDVIFLTRSTAANSNVIAYKYCPSPFPRITKFMYKPEQPKLRQSNARMLGCQAGKTEKYDKIVRIPVKRKHKADGPGISDRKVRFKETIEESVSNNTTLFESPVTNAEQGTESLDGRIDYASFSVTGKISCAVKESNHALESTSTLGNDKTTAFDGVEGVTHTPISASAHTVSTPSSTDSQSEFSKVLKSNEKRGLPLEEEVPNCDAFVQTSVTSGFNAPEDGGHHNMCTQCGKWIPHVTMSSHEAVCEGQSQEAKSQDHISLSSVPLKSITHTPVSASSHISTPSSTELGRSELSKALTWKSNEKLDSPLEEEVANCDAFVQTSGFNAPEDGGHHDKCTQCGKWIPHVTLSLHEAVCEGQSQEAKSQDHISLSSVPFESCLFRKERKSEIHSSGKLLINEKNDISVCSGASESAGIGHINKGDSNPERVEDESCMKKNVETLTTLPSTSRDLVGKCTESNIISTSIVTSCESVKIDENTITESNIISTSTVKSCESVKIDENTITESNIISTSTVTRCESGKMEENAVTMKTVSSSTPEQHELSQGSLNGDTASTSSHHSEPILEREDSKERCTFCSIVLPLSELILHASECSKVSAVPVCTGSYDTENTREACPYCGKYFEVLELVEHATHCKNLSRMKAEEVSLEDDPEVGGSDSVDDPSLSERELCPKCRREFPLLELLNHATECKEERHSTSPDLESPRGDVNNVLDANDAGKGEENFVDDESEDGDSDGFCDECGVNHEREDDKINDHVCSSDAGKGVANSVDDESEDGNSDGFCEECGVNHDREDDRINDHVRSSDDGSASDDDEDDEEDDDPEDEKDEVDDEENDDGDDDDVTSGDESSISDANDKDDEDDKLKDGELCTHMNSDPDNDGSDKECVDALVNSEANVGSDEFEFCPNCRKLFHLSRLVEHASKCISDLSGVNKAVESSTTATGYEENTLSTESAIVFSDCHYCRIRLPVHIMSDHYPKCEKEHLEKSTCSSEGVSKPEESDPAGELPEHTNAIDNLSTRITVKDDRNAMKCPESSTRTRDSGESSSSKVAGLHDAAADDGRDVSANAKDNLSTRKTVNDDKNALKRPASSARTRDSGESSASARVDDADDDDGRDVSANAKDTLSTRKTVKDDRNAVKRSASSTKTDDSGESSASKVARFDAATAAAAAAAADSRKAGGSKEVSLKRTTSSLDSYHDCEEQCMYCLKMFAVSVLVEHASICAGLHQSAADADDLEQCCYCLRTFPLDELIEHAQNCDQRTISSSQDSQDDGIANSQSSTGEVLERCMYCFKDFPVSKLIRHSQRCDGDMSGPRERFQGFLPSVHDLSAISSVAILNDTQRAALQYVITRSAQDSKSVSSSLLARVQRLGYSENDLKRTLHWVRSASPIIIHINLDKVLKVLVEDTHYRNRFETGTSGGSIDKVARKSWEDRIFNKAYHSSSPSERVKYGVLNIVGDPRGVRSCINYGDSFLQLKKVRLRTTFASMDTSGAKVKLSCCEHYENVMFAYTDKEITAIMDVATGKVPFHRSDCISHYKEVQIHGPVSLSENVECIVVNPRHQNDPSTTKRLDRFVEQNKCNLIWMDPDYLTGAAPFPYGPMGHYSSDSSDSSRSSRSSRSSLLSRLSHLSRSFHSHSSHSSDSSHSSRSSDES